MMLDLFKQLLGLHRQDSGSFQELQPILRAIVHSEALTEIVRASSTPIDDLILRIVRALVSPE
jgi:hypothetical protein